MKRYIDWDTYLDFPILYDEPRGEHDKPIEIPQELSRRYDALVEELDMVSDNLLVLWHEQVGDAL